MDSELEQKIRAHIEAEDASIVEQEKTQANILLRLDKAAARLDALAYDVKAIADEQARQAAEQTRQGDLINPLTEFLQGIIAADRFARGVKSFVGYLTLLAAGLSLTYLAFTSSVGKE